MFSIRVDHFHHFPRDPAADQVLAALADLKATTAILVQQGGFLMASVAQLQAELGNINAATNQIADSQVTTAEVLNEVAADINDLIARAPELPQALLDEATAISGKLTAAASTVASQAATLRTIADKHTPPATPPVEPPVDPPVEEPPPPVG